MLANAHLACFTRPQVMGEWGNQSHPEKAVRVPAPPWRGIPPLQALRKAKLISAREGD